MGGGLIAEDFSTDPSDLVLTEYLVVTESSREDGSVVDVTCDLGLHQKPAAIVEDDFLTDPANLPLVSESSLENESVVEVNNDLEVQKQPERTLVLVGRSGNGKSATGNSILGRRAFDSRSRASGVTTVCELQRSTQPNGQIINVIDTPGLFSLSPSTEFTCREIIRCLSLSKEGIDAVLLVFSLKNRLTEEEKSVLFALKVLFGSKIVDYMVVVFTNEDSLEDDGDMFEDYLKDCPDFKEILKECNDRMVLFGNRAKASKSQKAKQVEELLNHVEEIARMNGKPFMDDFSHELRENETAFQIKQREILEMKGCFTKQQMSQMVKDMVHSHENQQLRQMVERVETQLRETKERLEQQLNQEQAARLELEKKAKEAELHSSDVLKKLYEGQAARLDLEKRAKQVEEHSSDVVKKLNEEQAARLDMEKRTNKVEKNSSDMVSKLKEELKKAEKMTMELQEKAKRCIIL